MTRMAFKMELYPGTKDEYKYRHDRLWPEVGALLKKAGIEEYTIFFDEQTCTLFAVLKIFEPAVMAELRKQPVMLKWWASMKDILKSDGERPQSIPLQELFYLE